MGIALFDLLEFGEFGEKDDASAGAEGGVGVDAVGLLGADVGGDPACAGGGGGGGVAGVNDLGLVNLVVGEVFFGACDGCCVLVGRFRYGERKLSEKAQEEEGAGKPGHGDERRWWW